MYERHPCSLRSHSLLASLALAFKRTHTMLKVSRGVTLMGSTTAGKAVGME